MTPTDGSNLKAKSSGPGQPKPGGRSTGRIVAIAIAVVVALIGLRWVTAGAGDDGGAAFRTATVEQRQIVQTVEATGLLQPRDPMLVVAPVVGRLAEIAVKVRDTVEKGALLARLDARSLAFEVGRAQAGVAAAEGAVAEARAADIEARQQKARATKLANRGQLSKADLQAAVGASDRAKAARQVANAKLSEAQATLRAAQFAASQTDVVAPRNGVVLTVPNELGLAVSPAGPVLFTVSAPLDVLRLEAAVGEADIGALAVGQRAEFEVQAYPRQKFTAAVEAIGVVAKRGKGVATYTVTLTVPNDDGRLLPGMSAAVRFEVARAENVLAVRDAALRFRPSDAAEAPPRSRVFRVDGDGSASPVEVRVGISDGIWAEVTVQSGQLKAGDPVAVGYVTGGRRATPGLKIGG